MNVFLVVSGEKYEGYSIVSVHLNKENALAVALAQEPIFPGGWTQSSDGSNYWYNGCDFVAVIMREVTD